MNLTRPSLSLSVQWIAITLGVVLSSASCKQPFTLRGEPTRDFPIPWSKTGKQTIKTVPKPHLVVKANREEPIPSKELQRVAVLELTNHAPQQVTSEEVKYLTNEMRIIASYLPRSRYLVLTKESLEVLIDPDLKLEDCVGSCEVEVGRLVGAKWIITGEVMRFGESLRVSLKLHQTETGQFLKGVSLKGKTVEELEKELHQSALSLMKNVSISWGRELNKVAPGDLDKQLIYLRTHTP